MCDYMCIHAIVHIQRSGSNSRDLSLPSPFLNTDFLLHVTAAKQACKFLGILLSPPAAKVTSALFPGF